MARDEYNLRPTPERNAWSGKLGICWTVRTEAGGGAAERGTAVAMTRSARRFRITSSECHTVRSRRKRFPFPNGRKPSPEFPGRNVRAFEAHIFPRYRRD